MLDAAVEPTFFSAPESSWSLGDAAVELAQSAGLVLDPWQVRAMREILAEDDDGKPAAFEACLIVPRQNGKGSVLEALSLAWLFLTDTPLILHSAHEFKTAAEAFRRLRGLIQGCPPLWRRVERVTTAAGNEAIELRTGQRLRYVARSKGSGRGFTGGKLILDEAYAIEAEEMAALLPTLATQREGQIVYTSSAGMSSSTHLRFIRDRGRRGGDPSLAYLEWGGEAACPSSCKHDLDDSECALNDPDLWARANPGIGIRISSDFIAKERRALPPAEFARERLGVWDNAVGDPSIPLDAWHGCADRESTFTGQPVLSFDVSPDMRSAAICAAGHREDGLAHLEVVKHLPGTEWLPGALASLVERHSPIRVTANDMAHVVSLIPDIEATGVQVEMVGRAQFAAGCGALLKSVTDKTLRHLGDPILTTALTGAARSDVGDGAWAWTRKRSEVDISPLVAVTLAAWSLASQPALVPLVAFR